MPECEARFETPFAAVKRPCNGQEVPALRWADVGGATYGAALLNDSKYGYDALGNRLRLTLLRSAYDPDSRPDQGQHEFRYSFFPHPGDWQAAGVVEEAAGFNQPLLVREIKDAPVDSEGERSALFHPELTPQLTTVLIAGLKTAHDRRGRIIRLYESAGRPAEVALRGFSAGAQIWETNIVEDRLAALSRQGDGVFLSFQPWQVRTILVEDM